MKIAKIALLALFTLTIQENIFALDVNISVANAKEIVKDLIDEVIDSPIYKAKDAPNGKKLDKDIAKIADLQANIDSKELLAWFLNEYHAYGLSIFTNIGTITQDQEDAIDDGSENLKINVS